MNTLKTLSLTAAALALPLAASAQNETLVSVDFDGSNAGFFAFAGTGAETSNASDAAGNPGNAGIATLTTVTSQPSFAGGGFDRTSFDDGAPAVFNLSNLLGVAPGAFTAADFSDLTLGFDVATSAGAAANAFRLEVTGFDDRVEFSQDFETDNAFVSGGSSFADASNFDAFLTGLNASATGIAGFRFSIAPGADGVFASGDSVRVDNVTLTRVVPEPGSVALLGLGATALLARRRRA